MQLDDICSLGKGGAGVHVTSLTVSSIAKAAGVQHSELFRPFSIHSAALEAQLISSVQFKYQSLFFPW
jgi:hypothetical protein